jgi:cysteine desulfurase family protein (TIGR01976 family)
MPMTVEEIRNCFPALERLEAGYPVAYFDGPGGTQVPQRVVDRVCDYLLNHNANRHWAYGTSVETDEIVDSARAAFGDFLGASPNEIVFGTNMTTLTYHFSRALGRRLGQDDEIVVTELDHQANVAPWRALEVERGLKVNTAPLIVETGTLDWNVLESQISSRTALVAVGAASNALGTINDVRRVADLAHTAGALVFVDAVHFAVHELVDVSEMDCDFLACSPYKFYGPHLGVLFGRESLLSQLDVPKLPPAPDIVPDRFETGTLDFEGIAGAAEAVEFLASLAAGETRRERLSNGFAELHTRGSTLLARLWEGLGSLPSVTLYGPPPSEPRTPTIAFTVDGKTSHEVAEHLAGEYGVFVTSGDFYASTVTERLGLTEEGLVRAGCACYTTAEEVERLVNGVAAIP